MDSTRKNELKKDELKNGLLGYNFFPRVSKYQDEFPPCFVSKCLCDDHYHAYGELLQQVKAGLSKSRKKNGFGVIHANSMRSDYSPRLTEIPHPIAYCNLCDKLIDNYDNWKAIEHNSKSAIRVGKFNKEDKRIFVMRPREVQQVPVDARYLVKTDIAKFYDSIYSHAFAWAIMGTKNAKEKRDIDSWANEIDAALRLARRNETNGISIGPGTSSICGEIILEAIDESDEMKQYKYLHFIDDYRFYAASEEQAEKFILDLTVALSKFKLTINQRKTQIIALPEVETDEWLRKISEANSIGLSQKTISNFLDLSLQIQKAYPESSALRTALLEIERKWSELEDVSRTKILQRLFNIAFFYPAAVKSLCRLLLGNKNLNKGKDKKDGVSDHLNELYKLIERHSKLAHSDAVTWLLYAILHEGEKLSDSAVKAIIKSKDSLSLALLTETVDDQYEGKLVDFIDKFDNENTEEYTRDEYWLLYYQLISRGSLTSRLTKADGIKKYTEELDKLIQDKCKFIDVSVDFQSINSNSVSLSSVIHKSPYDD